LGAAGRARGRSARMVAGRQTPEGLSQSQGSATWQTPDARTPSSARSRIYEAMSTGSQTSARKHWVPRGGAPRSKTPPAGGTLPKCSHPLVMPAAPLWVEVARAIHAGCDDEPPLVPLHPPKSCLRQMYQVQAAEVSARLSNSTGSGRRYTGSSKPAFAKPSSGRGSRRSTPSVVSAYPGMSCGPDQDDLSHYALSSYTGNSGFEPGECGGGAQVWPPRSPTPAGVTPRSQTPVGAAQSRAGTPLGHSRGGLASRACTPAVAGPGPSRGATPISWLSGGDGSSRACSPGLFLRATSPYGEAAAIAC